MKVTNAAPACAADMHINTPPTAAHAICREAGPIPRTAAICRSFRNGVLRQNLWVKIGQFNGGAGVDFVRDGRTNKWCEAKGALAA
jgi:hypothetical protein